MKIWRNWIIRIKEVGVWLGKRFWEFRQFYFAYIALVIAISNWITVQYSLILQNIPILASVFLDLRIFIVVALILISIVCVLGGHYIHRKRQFRIEQELATEENPYLYRSPKGKERDLYVHMNILELETLEELLRRNNALTDEKKQQFERFKADLVKLSQGKPIGKI